MPQGISALAYLKYVHAASATRTIAIIHSDELLIPVFLAMDGILTLIVAPHQTIEPERVDNACNGALIDAAAVAQAILCSA
jgi:hypothetical protein